MGKEGNHMPAQAAADRSEAGVQLMLENGSYRVFWIHCPACSRKGKKGKDCRESGTASNPRLPIGTCSALGLQLHIPEDRDGAAQL